MIEVELLEKLSPELEKKMEKGLLQYESSHGIDVNYKRFSFVLKDNQEVIGIMNAFHSYSCIHIEDLWLTVHIVVKDMEKN